jgi:hypothetical protein
VHRGQLWQLCFEKTFSYFVKPANGTR